MPRRTGYNRGSPKRTMATMGRASCVGARHYPRGITQQTSPRTLPFSYYPLKYSPNITPIIFPPARKSTIMYVPTYVCVRMRVCMYVCMYTCMHVYKYIYIMVKDLIYIYIYIYILYIYIHVYY